MCKDVDADSANPADERHFLSKSDARDYKLGVFGQFVAVAVCQRNPASRFPT